MMSHVEESHTCRSHTHDVTDVGVTHSPSLSPLPSKCLYCLLSPTSTSMRAAAVPRCRNFLFPSSAVKTSQDSAQSLLLSPSWLCLTASAEIFIVVREMKRS